MIANSGSAYPVVGAGLASEFPQAHVALVETFFTRDTLTTDYIGQGVPSEVLLQALWALFHDVSAAHSSLHLTQHQIDYAAACEIRYQFGRRPQTRFLVRYLAACILNAAKFQPRVFLARAKSHTSRLTSGVSGVTLVTAKQVGAVRFPWLCDDCERRAACIDHKKCWRKINEERIGHCEIEIEEKKVNG